MDSHRTGEDKVPGLRRRCKEMDHVWTILLDSCLQLTYSVMMFSILLRAIDCKDYTDVLFYSEKVNHEAFFYLYA